MSAPESISAVAKLPKAEIRRGLNISTWEGGFGQIHAALTTSGLLTGFVLAWGANDFYLGLLGAIPFLAQVGQLVGAYLVDRFANRRREMVASLGLMARGTWLVIAATPFLFSEHQSAILPAILLLFLVYQLAYCASGPGWVAWMSVLVPARLRGRYLGRRNRIMELLGMTTALAAGWGIDAFRQAGREHLGFAVLQMLAGFAGIACFVLLRRQPDPGHHAEGVELNPQYLLRPMKDLRFRKLILFNVCWCFGLNVGLPFLNAHLLKDFGWNFRQLAVLGVLSSLAIILMNPVWGRLADSRGYKTVLGWCATGLLQMPLCYAFCTRQSDWLIYASNLFYGVFYSGFTLTLFSLTLKNLPLKARAMAAALFSACTAPATFLSSTLGGLLAQHWAGIKWQIFGLALGNYQLLFLLSLPLLVPAFVLLAGIDEAGDVPDV